MTAIRQPSVRRRVLTLTVAAGLVLAACGGGDDDTATDEPASEEPADDGGEPADDGGEPADDGGEPADDGDAGEAISEDGDERDEAVEVTIAPEENVDPIVGGTLRFGIEADVNGLNPTASSLSAPGYMMAGAVFDNLSAQTTDGRWVPYLAESFTPNDDFTSWDVKLREGIEFHDGTPLNAEAIQINFEAQRAHPLVGLAVKPFYPEEGATEILDDLTIRFNVLEPNALLPSALTSQLGMIASPAWLAAAAEDGSLNQAPIGTGPFMFDNRSEDSVTRFVRNENWWNGEVYLDAVEFFPVTDSDARVDLLLGGELDGLHTTNSASTLDLTEEGNGLQNILNDASEESFAMMNTSIPPFDDVRARKALTLASPVDLYNELIALGVNRPAEQMFIPENPYYNPDVVQEHDDPDGAAALVAEYCAERGGDENPLTGTTTCSDGKINIELQWSGPSVVQTRIADLLSEAWGEAGFNVTRDELLQDEHISQTAFGQYNVNTWRQFGAANPANDRVWLQCRTIGGISLNWPRFCDPERDALLDQAAATTDPDELASLYQEVVEMINQDYLYIFFNHTLWNMSFTEDVNGVCSRVSPEGDSLQCDSNGLVRFDAAWLAG